MIRSSPLPSLGGMLEVKLPAKHVRALINHFQEMINEFQVSRWEAATSKSGKFVEAVLKALWAHLGNPVPKPKDFKVDSIIRQLEQVPSAQAEDTFRLTIPRACRFVYEIASNRGARHDSDEVSPNEMDATVVVATCSWVLAELLRYAQKGAVNLTQAADLVAALTQKRFPPIEEVEGRIYFHFKGLSARDVALLTLWRCYPKRLSETDLVQAAHRHGSSTANARMGVSRLERVVDNDGSGNLRLLATGIQEAEELLSKKS